MNYAKDYDRPQKEIEEKNQDGSDRLDELVRLEITMDEMFTFKVSDYTTHIVGRRYKGEFGWVYYVERGDGTRWEYEEYRVEWANKLTESNDAESA